MTDAPASLPPPPRGKLVRATMGACAVAAVILVTIVLPAEYGIDPLRTGAALGLLRAPIADESVSPALTTAQRLTPAVKGPAAYYGEPFALDRVTFRIGPYEFMEYKYRLEQGASMQFAWEASEPVAHDFHGVPDKPASDSEKEVSFDKQPRRSGFGSYVAPFAGIHGWFWENEGGDTVTVTLTTTGYFAQAIETRSNRSKTVHVMTPFKSLDKLWQP